MAFQSPERWYGHRKRHQIPAFAMRLQLSGQHRVGLVSKADFTSSHEVACAAVVGVGNLEATDGDREGDGVGDFGVDFRDEGGQLLANLPCVMCRVSCIICIWGACADAVCVVRM